MGKHLVVIGGGISGLAAARTAVAEDPSIEVTVLEKESIPGGKAISLRREGWLVEAGPTGFLDNEPALDTLIEAVGLTKMPADEAAAHRFLVRGGKLREVQMNPVRFALSGIIGPLGLIRFMTEPFIPRRREPTEETVWDFANRRLGVQAAERMIAPMVLGVFAGNARKLSLPCAFPKIHALEQESGSLVRGMIAKKKKGGKKGGPAGPAGVLTSFAGGLDELPLALGSKGGFTLKCSTQVESITPEPSGGWRINTAGDGQALMADAVVMAGEPWAMSSILPPVGHPLAELLDQIYCPPVTVVALGFGPESFAKVPRGFGALIPREEGFRILGCLWDTHLFPGRSPQGNLLVRTMLGGAVDPEIGSLDVDEAIRIARQDLKRLLGIEATPSFTETIIWPRAIPQYEIGHRDRKARIEQELAKLPGLFLAGNALHGIAFGKAAAAGTACGKTAAHWLVTGDDGASATGADGV